MAVVTTYNQTVQALMGKKQSIDSQSVTVAASNINDKVMGYKPLVEQYASEYGIEDYVTYILAIMMVESGGNGNDVMQSSESLGKPPNSLTAEESIKQGCYYFSQAVKRAEENECDIWAAVQSYNFGLSYVYYVATNGKVHNIDLSEYFSRYRLAPMLGNASGTTYPYVNEYSQALGKTYLYSNGGNFLYAMIVKQYITTSPSNGVVSENEFMWPVPANYNYISSPFGNRLHPISHTYKMHSGIDIPVNYGADIYASKSGTVTGASYHSSMGNYVIIDHGGGVSTVYMHNSELLVSLGTVVTQGQVIAKGGSTGASTGNHCHFSVKVNGEYVDPMNYVKVP